ncbi:MAG: hypothetical protein AB1Z65_07585, partial [Candidatus Sulfomarinibacteraceae bacterium]
PLCGVLGYSQQTVDISAYADGGDHTLEFVSTTVSTNGGGTNFFVEDVSIAGVTCTQAPPIGDNAIPTVNGIGIVFLVGLMIGAAIVILRRMT